ncbi:pilus biosynthesis protein TadE [Bifidobacterium ramosum]|uniref:Pilus biosynthesis protein TadE n=3 Tax=Bifidobacterium ramosum TaxID=1798158 RepID=A0A6L4WXJ2_9BIFI|nr:pilus biosynthesis protein TadE [Bifidobacterium ramosum]
MARNVRRMMRDRVYRVMRGVICSISYESDRGSGTVAGAMLILVVGVMLSVVAAAGHLLVCQRRAQAVADVVAVSAANALRNGSDDPCVIARVTASANEVRLRTCVVDAEDVQVTTIVPTQVPFAAQVSRSARAGPVDCE